MMTDEEMKKEIVSLVLVEYHYRPEECTEYANYLNNQFELANIGKILTECLHIEFGLKGTKKEPLVNIYVTGGSNIKTLIIRDVPRTDDMDRMISFINELNFMNSIKERNKHDR